MKASLRKVDSAPASTNARLLAVTLQGFWRNMVLILSLLLFVWPAQGLADEPFRFAVLCDARGRHSGQACEGSGVSSVLDVVVRHILDRHKSAPMGLVLFPGDLMTGIYARSAASVAECNRLMLGHWRKTMGPILSAGIPLRITAGNHEAIAYDSPELEHVKCGQHNRPYIPSLANFQVLREVVGDLAQGDQGPANDLGFTYSFDLAGCHFAVLNAYTMFENNSFSNETIAWLEKDLEKAGKAGKKLFVSSHTPAFPGSGHIWDSLPFVDPTYNCSGYGEPFGIDRRNERDRFWNILKKHKVVAYFCGHEHNIQVQEVEGVWHVVSGGLTESLYPLNGTPKAKPSNDRLYDGQPQNPRASVIWPWNETKESYWGWCLVTVDGDKVTMDVFGHRGSETPPNSPDQLTVLKTFSLKP